MATTIIAFFHKNDIIKNFKKITSKTFDQPTWELAMARKDAGLMMAEANRTGVPLVVIPPVADNMNSWIAKGHGTDDWTVIAKDTVV